MMSNHISIHSADLIVGAEQAVGHIPRQIAEINEAELSVGDEQSN